jgi:hypothetical protein
MDFKSQLNEDLETVFFNNLEFAEEIDYNPNGGISYKISAIFDDEYESVDPETNSPILSTQPSVLINANDLQAAIGPADTVTVRGTEYRFVTDEPNGVGVIRLQLHRKIN